MSDFEIPPVDADRDVDDTARVPDPEAIVDDPAVNPPRDDGDRDVPPLDDPLVDAGPGGSGSVAAEHGGEGTGGYQEGESEGLADPADDPQTRPLDPEALPTQEENAGTSLDQPSDDVE